MKRWIHAKTELVEFTAAKKNKASKIKIEGDFSWNGFYYGYVTSPSGKSKKYYKAKTGRFDDTFGGTQEISYTEYADALEEADDYLTKVRGF